jgi:hypothetical protein
VFSNSNCIWKTISFICRNYLGCMGFIWNQELFGNVWNSLVGWSSSTRPIYSKVFMLSSEVAFWLGTLAAMDPTKRCKLNTVLHRMKILGAPKATFFWKQRGSIQYHTCNKPTMVSLTFFPWMRCWWHALSCWLWTVVYQLLQRPADIVGATAHQVLTNFLIQNHLSFKSYHMTLRV